MTMHGGLVDQHSKFKKRVASHDTRDYKVVRRNQIVVGFPIDEGVISIQKLYDAAIVSPAYDVWDLRDSHEIVPEYLERYLRSPIALTYYRTKLRGTTARRRTIPDEVFLELLVPLPRPVEQRRIADILDKADALRAKRRAALAKLDAFAESIFLDMFGDPATNPKRWATTTVGTVGAVQGGLQVTTARNGHPIELPYLRVANVYRDRLDLREVKTIRATNVEIERTRLKTGDLLIVEGHGNASEIGRCAIWDGSIELCSHQNHLIRVRLDVTRALPGYALRVPKILTTSFPEILATSR
jgi:type I restriction enzyme S subunit